MPRTPPDELLRRLSASYTQDESRRVLGQALARADQRLALAALGASSPGDICARARTRVIHVHRDGSGLEQHLGPIGDPLDAGSLRLVRDFFADLTCLAHAALLAHADLHGYDPNARVESFHGHASQQLEAISTMLTSGATRGYLEPTVRQLATAVIACIQNADADRDLLRFAQASALWAGTSLALFAVATAA